jgi:hypothetical protein
MNQDKQRLPIKAVMDEIMKRREDMATRRKNLMNATKLDEEIQSTVAGWAAQRDPVTGRPCMEIAQLKDCPWGRRVTLFNGHYIDFIITYDGMLFVSTTVKSVLNNQGRMKFESVTPSVSSGIGQNTLWLKDHGTPLLFILTDFVNDGSPADDVQDQG